MNLYNIYVQGIGSRKQEANTPQEAFAELYPEIELIVSDRSNYNVAIELLNGQRKSITYYKGNYRERLQPKGVVKFMDCEFDDITCDFVVDYKVDYPFLCTQIVKDSGAVLQINGMSLPLYRFKNNTNLDIRLRFEFSLSSNSLQSVMVGMRDCFLPLKFVDQNTINKLIQLIPSNYKNN